MSRDMSIAQAIAEPMMRAQAYIYNAPSYWMKIGVGLCLISFILLDIMIVFETSSAYYRDARGQLSGSDFWFCAVITVITVLVPTWAFHKVLGLLPERVWSRTYVVLALLAVVVVLAQPAILAMQEVMSEAASLEFDPASEDENSMLLFVILQLVRMPIFVMAMLGAAVGFHVVGHALERLRFIRLLKTMMRKASSALDRLTEASARSATLRSRLDDLCREFAMQVAGVIAHRALQIAQTIETYVKGEVLLGDADGWLEDLDGLLRSKDWHVPEKALRVAREQCPQAPNFDGLPNDGSTLPIEAKQALLNYANWLRQNYHFNTLVQEIMR